MRLPANSPMPAARKAPRPRVTEKTSLLTLGPEGANWNFCSDWELGTEPTARSYSDGIRVALQPLQVGAQLGGALAAQLAVLLEGLAQNRLELSRQSRIQFDRWHRILIQDGFEHDRGSSARKRLLAGRHLIQHHSERKEIGAMVQRLAARLLRRHIADGAHRRARSGELAFVEGGGLIGSGGCTCGTVCSLGHFRQTEIQNFYLSALRYENVRRLDVAVHDSTGMCGVEGVGDLNSQIEQLSCLQRTAFDQVFSVEPSRYSIAIKARPFS